MGLGLVGEGLNGWESAAAGIASGRYWFSEDLSRVRVWDLLHELDAWAARASD